MRDSLTGPGPGLPDGVLVLLNPAMVDSLLTYLDTDEEAAESDD